MTKPNQLQISLDSKIAKDFGIKLGDTFTLNIYGREIEGKVINFRLVNYRDLSINFAMLLNPQFAQTIPHEYLSTVKFDKINNFKEIDFLYNIIHKMDLKIEELERTNFNLKKKIII